MVTSPEPRWLDEAETRAWVALLRTIVWLPAALDAQLQRDASLSLVEYQVLSWLSMQPDRSSRMSHVAGLANVSRSHLSRIAARLEQRGLLERRADPEDGRATLATLTDAGMAVVVAAAPGHVAEARRLVIDNLTPDQVRELERIGTRIATAANPELTGPFPPRDDED